VRLTESAVSEIRACADVYRQADVARAYGVHASTVLRIWRRERYKLVEASPEPPNIEALRTAQNVKEDVLILANRGMKPVEIAEELHISLTTVYRAFPRWYLG
jgi:DNA invertase Pin-like site-specific DNA recombinase